ncbi:hypothetical protein BGX34_002961, partial [Mortierella sp. NVP85]
MEPKKSNFKGDEEKGPEGQMASTREHGATGASSGGGLSQDALIVVNHYLDKDRVEAERVLKQIEKHRKRAPKDQDWTKSITDAYQALGKPTQEELDHPEKEKSRKHAKKKNLKTKAENATTADNTPAADNTEDNTSAAGGRMGDERVRGVASRPSGAFIRKGRLLIELKLPGTGGLLSGIPQLVYCLSLLQKKPDGIPDPVARWLQDTTKNEVEQERLKALAKDMAKAFIEDDPNDARVIAEVLHLAPVLKDKSLFRKFFREAKNPALLKVTRLEGLAQLIQATSGQFEANDLDSVLEFISEYLQEITTDGSPTSIYTGKCELALAVSFILDAMADANAKSDAGLTKPNPLKGYLEELKKSSDPYLVYQAAYAHQAFLRIPDDKTISQTSTRPTREEIQGMPSVDQRTFFEDQKETEKRLERTVGGDSVVATEYNEVTTLIESGQDFMTCLKKGLDSEQKCDWYSVLRGTDILIRDGDLEAFGKLVCEAPCQIDPAFQWGLCQRLGEIAANPLWDSIARESAVDFLEEVYRNDATWGHQARIKQWILNILVRLASPPVNEMKAKDLLDKLKTDGDAKKQDLYRKSLDIGSNPYPLKVFSTVPTSSTLLDRIQYSTNVENRVESLRSQTLKSRDDVYLQPQAKTSLGRDVGSGRPLKDILDEYLCSERKVFLLVGDSGAGKATFNRNLEIELWEKYEPGTGRIPLRINLPAIDKPEHDMITKQLQKADFSELEIREMKQYRKFILICDGFDEILCRENLYTSNQLNQPKEWNIQMVISRHTNNLEVDYRNRFLPGGPGSDSSLFQEAVITPFTSDQVQTYIKSYVSVKRSTWQPSDYEQALELFPSLKELIRNPFLMALSMEALPRLVGPRQHISAPRITRAELYDDFVKQWLERSWERIRSRALTPHKKGAINRKDFIYRARHFLKRLSVAIYKNQGGRPDVTYFDDNDKATWKVEFFGPKDDIRLYLDSCPIARSGTQYQFIHPSLLEYGFSLAIFDPQDAKEPIESHGNFVGRTDTDIKEPNPESPLVWRNLFHDPSIINFLEDRAKRNQVFEVQLRSYIERWKTDSRSLIAAFNAITILKPSSDDLSQLIRDRLKAPMDSNTIYIPLQAKPSLEATDDTSRLLMEM